MQGSTIEQNTSETNDGCFKNYWNANYEVIKRCNMLLANIDCIGMDDTTADVYKAEVDPTGKTKVMPTKSYCNILKWFIPEDTANKYDGSLDFYITRYAEVLLSLSEAMIEKGGYPQAEITQYINEVRARVGMPAVEDVATKDSNLSQDQLRAIVRHERRVELAFEDLRFADLYRWNDWDNAIARKKKDLAAGLTPGYVINDVRGPQDYV